MATCSSRFDFKTSTSIHDRSCCQHSPVQSKWHRSIYGNGLFVYRPTAALIVYAAPVCVQWGLSSACQCNRILLRCVLPTIKSLIFLLRVVTRELCSLGATARSLEGTLVTTSQMFEELQQPYHICLAACLVLIHALSEQLSILMSIMLQKVNQVCIAHTCKITCTHCGCAAKGSKGGGQLKGFFTPFLYFSSEKRRMRGK